MRLTRFVAFACRQTRKQKNPAFNWCKEGRLALQFRVHPVDGHEGEAQSLTYLICFSSFRPAQLGLTSLTCGIFASGFTEASASSASICADVEFINTLPLETSTVSVSLLMLADTQMPIAAFRPSAHFVLVSLPTQDPSFRAPVHSDLWRGGPEERRIAELKARKKTEKVARQAAAQRQRCGRGHGPRHRQGRGQGRRVAPLPVGDIDSGTEDSDPNRDDVVEDSDPGSNSDGRSNSQADLLQFDVRGPGVQVEYDASSSEHCEAVSGSDDNASNSAACSLEEPFALTDCELSPVNDEDDDGAEPAGPPVGGNVVLEDEVSDEEERPGYSYFRPPGLRGTFVMNNSTFSLGAHCRHHRNCRINKVLRKQPLAYLYTWLSIGHEFTSARAHKDARGQKPTEWLNFTERSSARVFVQCDPCLAPLVDLEVEKSGRREEPKFVK